VLKTFRPFQFFLISCAIASLCSLLFGAEHNWVLIGCCILILAAGLPHGAFDFYIIANLYANKSFVLAIIGYLVLIAATVLLWWSSANIFLTAFLCYSAFHFGDSDWPMSCKLQKTAWGLAIITLPCLLAPQQVTILFTLVLGIAPAPLITSGMGYLAIPAVLLCGMKMGDEPPHIATLPLLSSYALVCALGGALIAFTCYFAFLHGPHHLQRWRLKLPNSRYLAVYLLSFFVFSIIALLVILAPEFNPQNTTSVSMTAGNSAIQYTFVALAALTVPHMTFLYIASKHR
tara:strand:+ start:267 stop:1133 length:867 start_codon:yes stop_codon:yes gene_type:complete